MNGLTFTSFLASSCFLICLRWSYGSEKAYPGFSRQKSQQFQSDSSTSRDKLIVVMTDGTRPDFIMDQIGDLPAFREMIKDGLWVDYVQPIFPVCSYPNWYTILTGLYAESHGFVGNTMYDRIYNSFFQVEGGPDNFKSFWWNQSEPLWITAEKNGIRTAVYFWDGCQVEISGTRVTKCVKNNDFKEWSSNFTDFRAHNRDYNQTVDEIIQRFQSDDWGLAMIYYPVIDELAHHFGTRHERTVRSIKVFDKLIHRILNKLKMTSMEQRVNLIVLSDHGMLDHSTETKHISLDDYIDYDDIEVSASEMGRVISLYVKPSRESKVMQNLKNAKLSRQIKIFSKSEIPPGYHYRNHYRIADILLIAKDANFIRNFKQETSFPPVNDVYYADHGWDFYEHPQEMKAFMTAIGPGFKKGFFSEPLIMTDHYNIFCHLLKINANPNNGSFEKISPFLTDDNCYFDTCGKSDDLIPREKCCDYC